MTRIRRINVSQVEGGSADNTDVGQIRPNGETAFYLDNNDKLTMMMFDGVRTHQKSKVLSPGVLFGSNADAGDGSTADTIKLIPDAGLGTDQYIVVDPTGGEPGHIHLRAGGTQDSSGADLYLGGELTFVRVSDTSDDVVIRTNTVGEGYIPHSWTFNDNGSLTVPGPVEQGNAKLDLNWSDSGYVMLTSKTDYTTSVFLGEGQASLTGRLAASITVGEAGQNAQTTYAEKTNELALAFLAESWTGAGYPAGINSSQQLNAAKALNPLIPDAWITIANELKTAWDTWQEVLTYSDVLIAVGGNDNVWKFDPTGTLTLPNDAVIRTDGDNVEVGGMTNFNVEAAGVVNIYTDDGSHQWQFGDDGTLTLPGGGVVNETATNIAVSLDQFTAGGFDESHVFFKISDTLYESPAGPTMELVSGIWRLKIGPSTYYDSTDLITWSPVAGGLPAPVGTLDTIETINLTVGDRTWGFDTRGGLTTPNGSIGHDGDGNIILASDSLKSVKLWSGNGLYSWEFGATGSLTFPDTTVQTTAFTGTGAITFTANEIEGNTFGGTGTTFTKSVDKDGSDYSTGGGTLPFINMGADSDVDNIRVGWIVTFASGETRTVSSEPYKPLGTYWFIGFDSSYSWSAGDVMPITFSSPDYVAGSDPEVTLTAGTQSWTFDDAGNLTVPGGIVAEYQEDFTITTSYLGMVSPPGPVDRTFTFTANGNLTFPDNTTQTTAYISPITTGSSVVGSPGGITRNGMSIWLTNAGIVQMSFDSVINIKGRYSINSSASTVINPPNGATQVDTRYDIGTALDLDDHLVATIVDSSFHNVYRVTVIVREKNTTPGSEFTTAYVIIEQLQ